MRDATFEFSEEQLNILQNITRNRFNFIEGPPGCGKTLLAQCICEKHGKVKSVYISKSQQLTNFVSHKKVVNAKCVARESDLLTTIQQLAQDVEHIVIDDAQNMCCDGHTIKQILDHCQNENKTLYVFQDSRFQNFQHKPQQLSFDQVYIINKDCYDGALSETLKVIRRNSNMVGSYITALIPDIRFNHQVEIESHVPGDDVIVKHVKNLRSKEDNGLVAHVKEIVSGQNVDPHDKHYTIQDVAILIDHFHAEALAEEIEFFKKVFQNDWPESCAQRADEFPVKGVIIDSLDNFSGLEARVVVFVMPEITSTDAVRSTSNPKYKIAIATRGIDRVDFVQEAKLRLDKLKELKFDNISVDLLQLQATRSLTTDDMIWSLAMTQQTGHVVMLHGPTDNPLFSVTCVTPDGRYQYPHIPPPRGWEPWSLALHPQTSDLTLGCRHRKDSGRYLVALYKYVRPGQWSGSPTHMEIQGKWRIGQSPHVAGVSASEAVVVAVCDRASIWWLVTIDVVRVTEVARVKTACREITDVSVSPEQDTIYLCDYGSDHIVVLTQTLQPLHHFPVTDPFSVCGVGGRRVLVCHHVTHGCGPSVAVGLWDREGRHIRSLVSGLHLSFRSRFLLHRVRVSEARREMVVCDGNKKTLRKYNVGRRLEP